MGKLHKLNCGDAHLFVAEESGKIDLQTQWHQGNLFLDISKKVFNKPNLKGFYGVTFHRDYFNGYFCVYYLNKQKNTVMLVASIMQSHLTIHLWAYAVYKNEICDSIR